MDNELKCNRLTCRKPLGDKAVVTTCSHIFCVECANELFNAARLCPACEASLSEPDDVVLCSLHPSNDYKTSVLSGLSPSIILEICTRAISFWQYQIHQESSFQQAVVRNLNDKNAQLQKQLDNVVREANGEISLLTNKTSELERDLELERRKVRELQEASRERDKEYQRLKAQHDKIKRKTLLAPSLAITGVNDQLNLHAPPKQMNDEHQSRPRPFGTNLGNTVDLGAVVGGMEANGIQRTPIVNRTMGAAFAPQRSEGQWMQQPQMSGTGQLRARPIALHRQTHTGQSERSYRSGHTSDRSDSANEVENHLLSGGYPMGRMNQNSNGWAMAAPHPQRSRPTQRPLAPLPQKRTSGTFRPAVTR